MKKSQIFTWTICLHIIIFIAALWYASWTSDEVRTMLLSFFNTILGGQ